MTTTTPTPAPDPAETGTPAPQQSGCGTCTMRGVLTHPQTRRTVVCPACHGAGAR